MKHFLEFLSQDKLVKYSKAFLLGAALLSAWAVVGFSLNEARDSAEAAKDWRERASVYAALLDEREKEIQAAEKDILVLEQRQSALASEKARVEDRQELYRDLSSDLESVIRAERSCRAALLAIIAGNLKKSSTAAEVVCQRADRAIEDLSRGEE